MALNDRPKKSSVLSDAALSDGSSTDGASTSGDEAAAGDGVTARSMPPRNGRAPVDGTADAMIPVRRPTKIATVSHTLDASVADRLRYFAFRERISESAVIEFALRELFEGADDAALGVRLRDSGAALRRKT